MSMPPTVGGAHEPAMTGAFIDVSSALGQTGLMRVLVVEDEARMASVIERALTKAGLAIDVAPDGEHALELAAIVDYDAIVLDVMLPGRSGFDVCRTLRERCVWAP